MKQNFCQFSQEDWNSELSSPAALPSEKKETGNKLRLRWLWDNLEKIVSILIIIYFLTLMVNLIAMNEHSPQLKTLSRKEREGHGVQLDSLMDLDKIQSILDAKTHHLQTAPPHNTPLIQQENNQKQQLFQMTTTKQLTESTSNKNSDQIENLNPHSASSKNNEIVQRKTFETVQEGSPVKELLQEVLQQGLQRASDKIYSEFEHIYQEIDQNLRKPIRALPLEQRQAIISKHFQQHHQNPLFSKLLQQNYNLSPKRSKEDSQYLQLLSDEYDLKSDVSTFICAVLTTRNNAMNGQITLTLNSVFNQQYKDYQVVIADTASSDNTLAIVAEYLKNNQWVNKRTKILRLESSSQARAVLRAAGECRQDSLVVVLDGNTELIGKQAFGIIDLQYQTSNALMLYPQQLTLDVARKELSLIRAGKYDQSQQFTQIYRNFPPKYGKIFAGRSAAISSIPDSHIQHNGKYFEYSGIESIAVSLLEMSCGRIRTIDRSIALTMVNSEIQKEERRQRGHQLGVIATKKKLDFC